MVVELEAAVLDDLFLALLDLGIEELLPEPCLERSGGDAGSRCVLFGSRFADPLSDRRGVLLGQFQRRELRLRDEFPQDLRAGCRMHCIVTRHDERWHVDCRQLFSGCAGRQGVAEKAVTGLRDDLQIVVEILANERLREPAIRGNYR